MEIRVPAAHKQVGDIAVRLEGCELTFSIGRHFHQQFPLDDKSGHSSDGLVKLVSDFVNNRCLLTVKYSGSRPVTARLENLETGQSSIIVLLSPKHSYLSRMLSRFFARHEVTKSFQWSGPRSDQDSSGPEQGRGASDLAQKLAGLDTDQMKQLADYLSKKAKKESDGSD
jgi:hypothetical protein